MKKKGWIALIVILILLTVAVGIYFKFSQPASFSVTPDYPINLNLVSGAEAITSIKITNNEEESHDFKIEFKGLDEIASISETEFSLESKKSKEIKIIFNDPKNFSHVYFANLIVTNTNFKKNIPVLLTFRDSASLFSIIQKPITKYFDVYPGGKLGVEIDVFGSGGKDYSKEVKASYELLSPEESIFYSEENLIVGNEYSFSKVFDINPELPYGKYVLVTSIEYNEIKSISSYLFEVKPKQNEFFLEKTNLLILVFFAFVILIIVLFIYFIKSRDELLLALRKQQSRELAKNIELITAVQRRVPDKKETLERTKKKVVIKIKKRQEKQIKELRRLKNKGVKKDKIKTQLEKWKKQGYGFPEIKKEIPEKSINKQITKWKRAGYREE
ncbi:MAG: hypothetical protein Q8O84_03290 [Nanoarchaeota archaeon]|nr:hypothetical protein [Nanoarchaeota archaeon]